MFTHTQPRHWKGVGDERHAPAALPPWNRTGTHFKGTPTKAVLLHRLPRK